MKKIMPIKIIIADDHQIVIDGLKSLLIDSTHIKVVGEALNGKQALELIKKSQIDIAVLDIDMPDMNGIEATKIIKEQSPETKILILTTHDGGTFVRELIELGVNGYILKNKGTEEFVEALETIQKGDEYLKGEVLRNFLSAVKKPVAKPVHFTKRELQVLKLIIEDNTSAEISSKLGIATSTVDTYRKNLIEKAGVKSSIGLVKYAIDHDFV